MAKNKKAIVKKTPVKKAPIKKTSTKKTIIKKAPVKKASIKKASTKKTIIKKAPIKAIKKNRGEGEEIKGLYKIRYGYYEETRHFIATESEVERLSRMEISIDVAKHVTEDVKLDDIKLITQDQDFIEKFIEFRLQTFSPKEYLDDEEETN